ncbi:hypothetical protein D018_5091 [Vibrio parahaemolyticus VP2007-007]|nr:hypothetical protein D018_5091 [Vibrio parahaemolyticus VP2007-007]
MFVQRLAWCELNNIEICQKQMVESTHNNLFKSDSQRLAFLLCVASGV